MGLSQIHSKPILNSSRTGPKAIQKHPKIGYVLLRICDKYSEARLISLLVLGTGRTRLSNSNPQNGGGAHGHSENYAPLLSLPKGDMPLGLDPLERTRAEDDNHFDTATSS